MIARKPVDPGDRVRVRAGAGARWRGVEGVVERVHAADAKPNREPVATVRLDDGRRRAFAVRLLEVLPIAPRHRARAERLARRLAGDDDAMYETVLALALQTEPAALLGVDRAFRSAPRWLLAAPTRRRRSR